jgi:2-aminoethylphosphonate-pyruvate transaminase
VILLTPGPLTTRHETRQAMMRDWGSRDPAFIALTAELRARLLALSRGENTHVCIPIQGSGTYVVEAALGSLLGPNDRLLVLENGVYGERMSAIALRLGRNVERLRWLENQPVEPARLAARLREDKAITHVALIHCETTTGILNPLEDVARVVADEGRLLIVDAMSSFGALPIDLGHTSITALLASSNKCLEGTPGIAFAIVARSVLEATGPAASFSLDLKAQLRGFESNGQWRFTPPVQVVAAAVKALDLLDAEGGTAARLSRYQENFDTLLSGMKKLGFALYLDEATQAPIIATFRMPNDFPLSFELFYSALAAKGYLVYPGKLTEENTFRIGCIGAVTKMDFEGLLQAVSSILTEVAPALPVT